MPAISLSQQCDVFLYLSHEILIAGLIANRAPQPAPKVPNRPNYHVVRTPNRSTRPITPDILSQFSVSFASCFNPLLVIE